MESRSREKATQKALLQLYAETEPEPFIRAVFALLQATTPGCCCSVMLRCYHAWGAVWFDTMGHRVEGKSMETMLHEHPGYAGLCAKPGRKLLPTRGILPEGPELLDSYFYRNYMVPLGWRHAVALCFWETPTMDGLDCLFSIHRTEAQGDFTPAEMKQLEQLHTVVDRARRRLHRLNANHAALRGLEAFVHHLPVGVAVLDWNLEPLYHNQEARTMAAHWEHGSAARSWKTPSRSFRVPGLLLESCAVLKEEWREMARLRPALLKRLKRQFHHPDDPAFRVQTTVMLAQDSAMAYPIFILQMEKHGPASPATDPGQRLMTLTTSERALALLVRDGHSNKEIAGVLHLSLATVKTKLHSIFQKLGVKSRAHLVASLR